MILKIGKILIANFHFLKLCDVTKAILVYKHRFMIDSKLNDNKINSTDRLLAFCED